ncbi:MAG TPA: PatB family C-S lyase [Anaerolineales bacterium]|jgi:cystathionine beta-lyase|nr:PatB family C-S lyase [Anaerolineales bacterium]HQX15024.1 PatB family C-S lyase [Anaerolineales bacterium]
MPINFDSTPNRRDPNVKNKWTWYPNDVLPMWVADMDFPAPKPILDELHKVVNQGVLGYEMPSQSLQETVAKRMDRLYRWKVQPDSVVAVTGIVSGFNVAARAFGSKKKGILVQPPVYNEFHEVKNNVGISQVNAPLVKRVDGNILSYEIDWDVFKKQVKKAGIFLLCNPHNPLGIIFSRKDLLQMAKICIENNVLIVSDEIHSELLLDDHTFTPMSKLSSEIAQHTITLIAPSKTFNVAGLFCGFAIIPNEKLRLRYDKEVNQLRLHVSSLGLHAARIAYSGQCDDWLRALRRYLTGNRDFLVEYVTHYMPGARVTIPDATYLGWLDFTELKLKESPFDLFMKRAKVALSDGKIFGMGGEGHVRLNFGTSRKILRQGLDRMCSALK